MGSCWVRSIRRLCQRSCAHKVVDSDRSFTYRAGASLLPIRECEILIYTAKKQECTSWAHEYVVPRGILPSPLQLTYDKIEGMQRNFHPVIKHQRNIELLFARDQPQPLVDIVLCSLHPSINRIRHRPRHVRQTCSRVQHRDALAARGAQRLTRKINLLPVGPRDAVESEGEMLDVEHRVLHDGDGKFGLGGDRGVGGQDLLDGQFGLGGSREGRVESIVDAAHEKGDEIGRRTIELKITTSDYMILDRE